MELPFFAGEMNMRWTQEQAIAFECARETITDMMAILTDRIYEEKAKATPDEKLIARLEAEQDGLDDERAALRVEDRRAVAKVIDDYGPIIRQWRAERASPEAAA